MPRKPMEFVVTEPAFQLDEPVSPLRHAWRTAVAFWSQPIRAEPLALCRIMAGIVLIASLLFGIAPNLALFWFSDGLIPLEAGEEYGRRTNRLSLLYWFPAAPMVVTCFVIWVLALGSLTVGFFCRTSAFVAFVMAVSFNMRSVWALNGGDDVTVLLLFYLMIAPSGAAWSIDSLRRRVKQYRHPERGFELISELRRPEPAMIPPWSVRLMQIQLCLIYFMNGVNKFHTTESGWISSDYLTGEALYYILHDSTLIRFSFDQFPIPFILCLMAGWLTLLFELGFPFLVMVRVLRPWLLAIGVLFHLGIFIVMEIGWFGQITLCFYPLLLSGAAVHAFAAWLARAKRGEKYHLYYDTFCPICRRTRAALALFDVGQRIVFRDIHDRETMQRDLPDVPYSRGLKEMIVRTPGGKVLGGFDAFRRVARVMPALWPVLPVLYFPGVALVGRRVYKWIATNRYRLTSCDHGVCSLHLRALQQENLDEEQITRVVNNAREAAGFARLEPDGNAT